MLNRLLTLFRPGGPARSGPAGASLMAWGALPDFDAAIEANRFDPARQLLAQGTAGGVTAGELDYMHARLAAEAGDFSAAIAHARQALAAYPADVRCSRALAVALTFGPRVPQALEEQRHLLSAAPADLSLLYSAALTAKRQGHYAQAETWLRAALQVAPEHPQMHSALAFNLFQQGRYDESAWEHFVQQAGVNPWHGAPHAPQQAWQGQEDAGGLRIWLAGGLGDFFHFCRFIPLLHQRRPGLEIELELVESLREVAQGVAGVTAVVAPGTPLRAAQAHVSLLALPFMLGAFDPDAFWGGPYLDARQAPPGPQWPRARRVGLVWRSGRSNSVSAIAQVSQTLRDLPLVPLLAALPGEVEEVVSLQQGVEAHAEIAALPTALRGCVTEEVECASFADTVRAIRSLDVLVSVDTAAAHLAGAMGHPLYVLSDYDPYWGWRGGTGASAWYPWARVLVQDSPGVWSGPLAALGEQLRGAA